MSLSIHGSTIDRPVLETQLLDLIGFDAQAIDLRALRRLVANELQTHTDRLLELETRRSVFLGARKHAVAGYELRDAVVLPQGVVALTLVPSQRGSPELHFVDAIEGTYLGQPRAVLPRGYDLVVTREGLIDWAIPGDGRVTSEVPAVVMELTKNAGHLGRGWNDIVELDAGLAEVTQCLCALASTSECVAQHAANARLAQAGVPSNSIRNFRTLELRVRDERDGLRAGIARISASLAGRVIAVNNQLDSAQRVKLSITDQVITRRIFAAITDVMRPVDLADSKQFAAKLEALESKFRDACSLVRADIVAELERRIALAEERVARKMFHKLSAGFAVGDSTGAFEEGRGEDGKNLLERLSSDGVSVARCYEWACRGTVESSQEGTCAQLRDNHFTFAAATLIRHMQRLGADTNDLLGSFARAPNMTSAQLDGLVALEGEMVRRLPWPVARSLGARTCVDQADQADQVDQPVPLHARLSAPATEAFGPQSKLGSAKLGSDGGDVSAGFVTLLATWSGDGPYVVGLGRCCDLSASGGDCANGPCTHEGAAGHAVALRRVGASVEFFDPDVGVFRFASEREFLDWLPSWTRAFRAAEPWSIAAAITLA